MLSIKRPSPLSFHRCIYNEQYDQKVLMLVYKREKRVAACVKMLLTAALINEDVYLKDIRVPRSIDFRHKPT
jgi:hypothetical protein